MSRERARRLYEELPLFLQKVADAAVRELYLGMEGSEHPRLIEWWAAWCDESGWAEIRVASTGPYAQINADLLPCWNRGQRVADAGLRELASLLRRETVPGLEAGGFCSGREHFRVTPSFCFSHRVPAERAEVVAAEMCRIILQNLSPCPPGSSNDAGG